MAKAGKREVQLSLGAIDEVLKETVRAIRQGQEQLFQIADLARDEYRRLQIELDDLNLRIQQMIAEVDESERLARQMRRRLMEVSRDFYRYSEEEVRSVYQEAEKAQVALSLSRERERELRQRREETSKRLRRLEQLVNRADQTVQCMGAAVDLLSGKLNLMMRQIEGWRVKSQLGSQIIRAQEAERQRVAREIHDGPAQTMANVVLQAELCNRYWLEGKGDLSAELNELKKQVQTALREVRRIISDLRPTSLDDLGLVPTLRRLVEEFSAQGEVQADLVVNGRERRLGDAVEVACFRLVQEALQNVRRHARARRARVLLSFGPEEMTIVVEDDGVGFDPAATLKNLAGDHFGLVSMRERIELLEGKFRVLSAPGEGTRVIATVPLGGEESAAGESE